MKLIRCKACHKIVTNGNRIFCSNACHGKILRKPDYKFTCKICGKLKTISNTKWKRLYHRNTLMYCSWKCNNKSHIGRKRSDMTRNLLKKAWVRRKRKGLFPKIFPNYNKNACKIFDEINKELGWNGRHALNKGEFYIKKLGYWVDYYEPKQNIVIEYDEKRHKNQKSEDNRRMNKIKNLLRCKFFRIKDGTDWRSVING